MDKFQSSLNHALHSLRKGNIILYPTDTVWGIGCEATNAAAIDRIYQLKQRNNHKSMIILVAEERAIFKYTAQPDPALFNLLQESDRPTTIIYENALGLPDNLVNEDGSIAIRLVQEPFCKALIKRLKKPVVSTSANRSGEKTPSSFDEISDEIKAGVDYITAYRQEEKSPATPSRVIKIKNDGTIETIRA